MPLHSTKFILIRHFVLSASYLKRYPVVTPETTDCTSGFLAMDSSSPSLCLSCFASGFIVSSVIIVDSTLLNDTNLFTNYILINLKSLQIDVLENYVNLPLSLMVNEVILTVLFILAGVSVLVSLCAGSAKIGGILAGVSIEYSLFSKNCKHYQLTPQSTLLYYRFSVL